MTTLSKEERGAIQQRIVDARMDTWPVQAVLADKDRYQLLNALSAAEELSERRLEKLRGTFQHPSSWSPAWTVCPACKGGWYEDTGPERHNPIDGKPCPAER